jgi:Conjugative transposon protein TcpC
LADRGSWRVAGDPATVRTTARLVGRILLWAFVALVLARGLGDILGFGEDRLAPPATGAEAQAPDDGARAFAAGFARAYLKADGSLGRYVPEGLAARGMPERRSAEPVSVEAATIAAERRLAAGRVLITVACELAGGAGTRYVAVPLARDARGRLAVFAPPALVAGPGLGDVVVEEPAPLAGPQAASVERLAERFLAGYLSAGDAGGLGYLSVPGARVAPAGPDLKLLDVVRVGHAGPSPQGRRTVLVEVRARDRATRSVYPLEYRLDLVRRDRWYVARVRGALR